MEAEISTGKPYRDKPLDANRFIRKFDKDASDEEFIWHRDKKTRIVSVAEGEHWQLQFDNELPIELVKNETYTIEKEIYHRIIKGNDTLVLDIEELGE